MMCTVSNTPLYIYMHAQLCLTFCKPMDCSPPSFFVHGDSTGRILEWIPPLGDACLQGIFPTQGSNPGLLHCGWILYQQSHRGSPQSFLTSAKSHTCTTRVPDPLKSWPGQLTQRRNCQCVCVWGDVDE